MIGISFSESLALKFQQFLDLLEGVSCLLRARRFSYNSDRCCRNVFAVWLRLTDKNLSLTDGVIHVGGNTGWYVGVRHIPDLLLHGFAALFGTLGD